MLSWKCASLVTTPDALRTIAASRRTSWPPISTPDESCAASFDAFAARRPTQGAVPAGPTTLAAHLRRGVVEHGKSSSEASDLGGVRMEKALSNRCVGQSSSLVRRSRCSRRGRDLGARSK